MRTRLTKADVSALRDRLEGLREDVRDRRADRGTAREAESLSGVLHRQMGELLEGARAAGRELHASEARLFEALEEMFEEANRLGDDARAQALSVGQEPVFGRLGVEDPAAREAFDRYLRTGEVGAELRAMSVGTDSAGGYAVPEGFRAKVTETLKAFGGLRRLAEVIETDTGQALPWPTNDDTANTAAILAENTAAGETDLVLGQKQLGAYMYSSDIVKASVQLIQDNGVNLERFLSRKLGERIGRGQAPHWVTGTGTGQPQGITVGGTVGVTGATGQTTTVTYDDLVDLVHSVDPAYREQESECAWVMRDSTFAAIRKLKDADGRPLVEPSVKAGAPNTLLGFRVVIDNGMPAMGASAKSIAFGNFRAGYIIRVVRDIAVVRFGERYMDALQLGFLAFERADGLVQDADAYRLYQNSTT